MEGDLRTLLLAVGAMLLVALLVVAADEWRHSGRAKRRGRHRPADVSAAATYRPATPVSRPPADPLADTPRAPLEREPELLELLELSSAAVKAIPRHLSDAIALRAERDAARHQLLELAARGRWRGAAFPQLLEHDALRIKRRLRRVSQDAYAIATDCATLEALALQLRVDAAGLIGALDELGQQAEWPVVMDHTGPVARGAAAVAARIADPQALTSHDAVRREIARARGVARDLELGAASLERARAQRHALLELLRQPELAEQSEWLRAIQILCWSRQGGRAPESRAAEARALLARAEALAQRRRDLLAEVASGPSGRACLGEAQLEAVLAESRAIRQGVRALWQSARLAADSASSA